MERGARLRSSILLGIDGDSNGRSVTDTRYIKPKPWHKSRLLSMLCVVWLIFTLCLAIMMIVTLVQPQWIGRNLSGAKASFGLYRACSWTRTGDCEGSMLEFDDIPSQAWRAASVLVLLSVIICFVAMIVWTAFWLRFFDRAYCGFRVSSILVFVAGACSFLTCFWGETISCITIILNLISLAYYIVWKKAINPKTISNLSSVDLSSERNINMFLSDESTICPASTNSTLETFDFAFLYQQYTNFSYFDLYLNSAYAAHYVYLTCIYIRQ